MHTVVVEPKNKQELKLVSDLLNGLGISSRTLSPEEVEDLGLALLMKSANRRKKVSREIIFRKLAT